MSSDMTRATFDKLDPMAKREALKTHKLVDETPRVSPDTTRLVSVKDGVRRVFTRQAWDVLEATEKARLGAELKIEYVASAAPDAIDWAEVVGAVVAKIR